MGALTRMVSPLLPPATEAIWRVGAIAVCVLSPASVIFAAGAANPMVRPPGLTQPTAGANNVPGLPPVPVARSGQRTVFPGESVIDDSAKKRQEAIQGIVDTLSVSSILGDSATLRIQIGPAVASTPASGSATQQQAGRTTPRTRSMNIKHKVPFSIRQIDFLPFISEGLVTLTDAAVDKKLPAVIVFTAGIESSDVDPRRADKLEVLDAAVATRVAPKIAGATSSSSSSSATATTAATTK